MKNLFFDALNIEIKDNLALHRFARSVNIPVDRLRYYNQCNIIPSGQDLKKICDAMGISQSELMMKMGVFDAAVTSAIQKNATQIYALVKQQIQNNTTVPAKPPIVYKTTLGQLHQGDCFSLMKHMESDSVDLIFADPPFNLNKLYPSKIDDNLKSDQYLKWCKEWADECIRILKQGGSFFLWNLPKWNTFMAGHLNKRLTFRHWIAVDIKYTLPIKGRLYPSHYSLLYYCKGEKATRFHPDRLPMSICPHCVGDLKDYGGYKHKMNPDGINITDVWLDIPPVRHKKYKKRNGANELSVRLLDRIIEMASDEGDLVFDPFGGSGTTYAVSEVKNRQWIGIEIGTVDPIIKRLENIEDDAAYLNKIRKNINCLITKQDLKKRIENNWWTPDSVRKKIAEKNDPGDGS